MNKLIAVIAACVLAALPLAAAADEHGRAYTLGTVWSVGYVETKPGKFDAYIEDLSNVWKAYLDQQIKDGTVVSYKVLTVVSPRDGEPNLLLLVESPNWASFDLQNLEYFDELAVKLQGSIKKSQKASIDRGALRDLRGGVLAQELNFK